MPQRRLQCAHELRMPVCSNSIIEREFQGKKKRVSCLNLAINDKTDSKSLYSLEFVTYLPMNFRWRLVFPDIR